MVETCSINRQTLRGKAHEALQQQLQAYSPQYLSTMIRVVTRADVQADKLYTLGVQAEKIHKWVATEAAQWQLQEFNQHGRSVLWYVIIHGLKRTTHVVRLIVCRHSLFGTKYIFQCSYTSSKQAVTENMGQLHLPDGLLWISGIIPLSSINKQGCEYTNRKQPITENMGTFFYPTAGSGSLALFPYPS